MAETLTAAGVARTIALSAITVREGFNPRTHFDETELRRLAQTIRETGVLQPILVQPAETGAGEFELVDGERRYRASFQAGLTEIPALIRPRETETGGLVDALTANFHHRANTPVEMALAFARLLEAGLTRKGISERSQVSREIVRERLEILQLPRELHAGVDDGSIPLGAIRALAGLAKLHSELAVCAVRRVLSPPVESWRHAVSWSEVIGDPIGAITPRYHDGDPELPAGVFDVHSAYPLSAFGFDEAAEKSLKALVRLNERYGDRGNVSTRLDGEALEHATRLGAAHVSEDGSSAIIVGQDVAALLVADQLKRALKTERARQRDARERAATAPASNDDAADAAAPAAEPESEEAAATRRRAEREAELARRATAVAFNLELGIAVVKAFARVKLDERVLRVVSAIDFAGEVDALALRGARYGFPGWPKETATAGGKAKTAYLERHQAAIKAHEYLSGAVKPDEIAGRCIALAVMAVLADETCVALSSRSMVSLQHAYAPSTYAIATGTTSGLPWRRQALELLEDLALERLPEHLTSAIRDRRAEVAARRAAIERSQHSAAGGTEDAPVEAASTPGPDVPALAGEPVAA